MEGEREGGKETGEEENEKRKRGGRRERYVETAREEQLSTAGELHSKPDSILKLHFHGNQHIG